VSQSLRELEVVGPVAWTDWAGVSGPFLDCAKIPLHELYGMRHVTYYLDDGYV